jgi:DNA-binding MarR family transcriptional regulator
MKSNPSVVAGIVDDIRRIFHVLTAQSKKVELETGLTGPQLWVIKILEENSPFKVSDLARRMYLHPATMVGLLDRLEVKGLVQRTRSETDRRVVNIDLTEQGRALVRKSPEVVQRLLINGLVGISEQKLRTISDGLGQVVKILGAQDSPP